MSASAPDASGASLPRWLPWLLLGFGVLPFHPHWLDFEQVRRGILLVLAGACLVLCKTLQPVRGERLWLGLVGWLFASTLVNLLGQCIARTPDTPLSFQPWDALYRLAHWVALGIVLRLGAAMPTAFGTPLAGVLCATSLFGLLQRAGLGSLAGYGLAHEPVSVFGNLNVASEGTAVIAMAVAVSGQFGGTGARRWLGPASLALGAAYLVVNHSRSGLLALPLGLLVHWVLRRRSQGWLPLAFAVGGAAIGLVLDTAAPRPAPRDRAAVTAAQGRSAATLDVRLEIHKGSAHLFAENPVFGHGPGQFAVQYARVRSQAEIELSSLGRQFATTVPTAHDDWLELLVEGGLPAIVLFSIALFALQRGMSDKVRLLPLFVFMLLMFVRSPLGNAPAAVAALLLVGHPVATRPAAAGFWRVVGVGLGLLLVALGLVPIVANCLFTPYQGAIARGDFPPRGAVAAAAACMPFEPRWLQLLAQEQMNSGDLAGAASTAARALTLRPYEPPLYLLLGEILARGNKYDEAQLLARHALQIDPPNPELRVLLSTVLAQQMQPEAAIAAVVIGAHPSLRAQLGPHFRSLAKLASERGNPQVAARFAFEQHFLGAVDNLGLHDPAALAATGEHVKSLLLSMQTAGLQGKDLRFHVVRALHAIDVGKPEMAIDVGEHAKKLAVSLADWQRELFGSKLEPLQRFEPWVEVLKRR